MKQFLSLILSLSIMFTSISAASALDVELPKSLESFTEDVSALINEYEETASSEEPVFFTADDETEMPSIYDTNRLIVKSAKRIDTLNSVNYVSGYNDLYILQFADDNDCDAAFEYYSSLSYVQYVQEDGVLTETAIEEKEASFQEASIDISSQYQSDFFGYTNAKANMGSAEVTIAVVDTGVENDHEYLKGRVIPTGFDSVNNESCYDKRGHGTHVAGIIVANTKSNVKIKPYKVIGDDGTGTDTQLYLGIQAAIADGVDIINLSVTRSGESDIVHEAVINAYNAGITVVAAAGNNNENVSQKFYTPASFPEVICAVGVSTTKYKTSSSNWGSSKDLSAPGEDILSSFINNTYKILTGTSMAAPFISCCVAYLLADGDYYTPDEAYSTLYSKTRRGAGTHNIHYVCPGTLVNSGSICSSPNFTYESGDFAGYLDVKLTCATSGATIMYRTSDMNTNVYYEYTSPVRIDESTTFTAYAFCKNYKNSTAVSASYTKNDIDASMFVIDENDVLVGYNGTDTDVTVPGYFNGGCVVKVSASAFSGNTDLTAVNFSKYLKIIGEGAFEGCTSLACVSAQGVTDIESEAFKGCTALNTVTLPSAITIGDKAFLGCASLTSLTANYVTEIGNSVFENSGITDFTATKLVSIGDSAFYGTDIKNFSFTNVTSIGNNAFAYCDNLTNVTLNKEVSIDDFAFYACENLEKVQLSVMTKLGNNVFRNCTALESVAADNLTEIGDYTFFGCTALKTLSLPVLVTVGEYTFAETGLEAVALSTVKTLGTKALGDCLSLKSITLPVLTDFSSKAFEGSVNVESLSLKKASVYDFGEGKLSDCFPNLTTFSSNGFSEIPDYFFDGCSKLSSVTLASNVLTVGDYAFRGTALDTLSLPEAINFGTGAFSDMTSLESVTLQKATDIDFSIFAGSTNVKFIKFSILDDLPEDFRCNEIFPKIESFYCRGSGMSVPDYAFKGCSNLSYFYFFYVEEVGYEAFCGTAVNDPYFSTVSSVGERAFADCTNLGDVSMASLPDINMNVFENSENTVTGLNLNYISFITDEDLAKLDFRKFTNLQSVALNRQTIIPENAFKDCTNLSEIIIGSCKTIGKDAFANCISLKNVKLASAKTIESSAFSGCTGLESFSADKVTTFDFDTFNGCSNLKTLSFNSVFEFPVDENGSFELTGLDALQSFSADSVDVVPANFLRNCKNLKTVSFANAGEIGEYAFYKTPLSVFNMPCVTIIGDYAFYGTDITTISLDNLLSVGEYAFSECDLLQDVNISSITTLSDGVFANCDNVTSIELASAVNLPVNAISGCTNVTNLDLGQISELTVEDDGSSYVSDKPLLVSFTAQNVLAIPDEYFVNNCLLEDATFLSATTVGDKAFMNTNLRDIPSEELDKIGDYAFYGTELSTAYINCATEIGDYAFAECSYLNSFVIYTDFSELTLGKGVCENDTALTRAAIYGNNIELPDYTFKNCTKLTKLYATDSFKRSGNYANLISIGDEALYGCNAMNLDKIRINEIQVLGKKALDGFSDTANSIDAPALISVDEGAFGDQAVNSLALENIEILRDVPECSYIVIGSDIKEFSCDATDTTFYSYENSIVNEYCTENGLNFKKYDGVENIVVDVEPVVDGYENQLYFDAIGFNLTYKWYACNKPDRSDAVEISTTMDDPRYIDPIAPFFDNYEENKYSYFYCVATSIENGNELKIQSALSKNLFATIMGTKDTFIDFLECGIFTHSLDNINTLDNIFTVDGDIKVIPSYSTETEACYGTGTIVEIMNGDEVALAQTVVVYGDINGDGVVDALDVSKIEMVSNGNSSEFAEKFYEMAADTDGSGSIDALDYQTAVNKALAS